jgi:tryptophanyl-tRNA synthetase
MNNKKIVMSMIQPTGKLHLGNYLGAVKQWVELQDNPDNDCRFGIANLHALTNSNSGDELLDNTNNMLASLLALGIKRDNLYLQSEIQGTTQLMWVLTNHVSYAEMGRMTQFKDKGGGNMGLFTYPILQAADILIHNAHLVPVGEDQKQHLELSQTIAARFNAVYGETFNIPKPLIIEGTKVLSIRDPEKKMSKSLGDEHCIYLDDTMDVIEKKINKMPTDNGELKGTTEMTPGVLNIYNILKALLPVESYNELYEQYVSGSIQYSNLKQSLKDCVMSFCKEYQENKARIYKEVSLNSSLFNGSTSRQRINGSSMIHDVIEKTGIF